MMAAAIYNIDIHYGRGRGGNNEQNSNTVVCSCQRQCLIYPDLPIVKLNLNRCQSLFLLFFFVFLRFDIFWVKLTTNRMCTVQHNNLQVSLSFWIHVKAYNSSSFSFQIVFIFFLTYIGMPYAYLPMMGALHTWIDI